ncbi:MAG: tetratricopeptide repeat protein [Ectothiorhodospiraceae bacterium]|nr:tetratricopeptide repeat protein [Ectothiorhodospiraceae bacterium]
MAGIGLVLGVLFSSRVLASADSLALVEQGARAMEAREFETALQHFDSATRTDPGDAQAHFFAGAALNRLGRSAEALARFERVLLLSRLTGLAAPHPELDFERGFALVREQRHAEALAVLERYERDHPGRGQTAELTGRALIGLGRYDEAGVLLERAIERDPALAPTVQLARAAIASARGDVALATRALAEMPRSGPVGRHVEDAMARAPRTDSLRRGGAASVAVGRNSDAITILGDERVGVSGRQASDGFVRAGLSGYLAWRPQRWSVVASASLQTDDYFDASQIDQIDLGGSVSVDRLVGDRYSIGMSLSDRHTWVDGSRYLDQLSIGPQVGVRLGESVALAFEYRHRRDAYRDTPVLPQLDRDASVHQLGPRLDFRLNAGKLRLQLGSSYAAIDADGDDFDAGALGVNVLVSNEFTSRLRGRIYLSAEHRRFSDPNSLTGLSSKRRDRTYYVQAYAQYALAPALGLPGETSVFAQIDRSRRVSNIDFYDYDQTLFTMGLLVEF